MEILKNNFKLPKLPIDDFKGIGNIINSLEFINIYNYYLEELNNSRLKDLPDYEKRLSFYLYYTGHDQYINHINNMLYQRKSPSITEFLQDPQYLGAYWSTTYPYWRKQLQHIFDDTNSINTAVFSGAIGTGKSTIARRGFLYTLYRMCCLRYPHSVLNVTADTTLASIVISVTLGQVNNTVFAPLTQMLEAAPCFQRVKKLSHFSSFKETDPVPYIIENGGIRFPNNIFLGAGSQVQHAIGYSIFNCWVGETLIKTNNGNKRIDELDKFSDKVYNFDENGKSTLVNIKNLEKTREVNDLIELELEDGNIFRCTYEHKLAIKNPKNNDENIIWINNIAYKEAQYLTEEDEISEGELSVNS